MSGLVNGNLVEELQAEVAWLRQMVLELAERVGHQSYISFVLANHLEPEEIKAFEGAVFFLGPERAAATINELEARCAALFLEQTGKPWTMRQAVLTELFRLHLSEFYSP